MRAVITPQFPAVADTEPVVVGRVSLEAVDEFGPLGWPTAVADSSAVVLEDELTELGGPLACPYVPAEYLL